MALLHYHPPLQPYLKLLFRDEHLLVVEKPSGLLSVPGKAREHYDSVYSRITRVLPEAKLVHRLDMATSGIILFANGRAAQSHLSRQFQQRIPKKVYHARVAGCPPAQQGWIDLPLCCDWPNRPRQQVDYQNGKPSQTYYRVITTDANSSLLELSPYTGRSHQLRVHLQALGCPILGDKFYAHAAAFEAAPRLLLHAHRLEFQHPVSEHWLTFTSPTPFQ
ncbi:RNA pseudouridine synthase [Idiomarina seosinensis]|uniref:pseudouridine synthase n=1 Tax=Idiomarina seosinensis TaxID=281739 RepID=UPI0038513220